MEVRFNIVGLLCSVLGAIFISGSNLSDDIALPMVVLWSMFCGLMSTEVHRNEDDPQDKE